MKKSDLEDLIRTIVREEFRSTAKTYIGAYVPVVMTEVLTETIDKKINKKLSELLTDSAPAKPRPKKTLKEAISLLENDDEFETLGGSVMTTEKMPAVLGKSFDRSKLAGLMGLESIGSMPSQQVNSITTIVTETGVEMPVPPDAVPPEIVQAVNKDYRGFLQKMNAVTQSSRGA